ncbi:7900_t:CDS:2, partial [Scutellospora calospora]
ISGDNTLTEISSSNTFAEISKFELVATSDKNDNINNVAKLIRDKESSEYNTDICLLISVELPDYIIVE